MGWRAIRTAVNTLDFQSPEITMICAEFRTEK